MKLSLLFSNHLQRGTTTIFAVLMGSNDHIMSAEDCFGKMIKGRGMLLIQNKAIFSIQCLGEQVRMFSSVGGGFGNGGGRVRHLFFDFGGLLIWKIKRGRSEMDSSYSTNSKVGNSIYIKKVFTLIKVALGSCLSKSNLLVKANTYSHSLYFLKGNDDRLLSTEQAQQIDAIISNNKLQTSCLLYNPSESARKFDNWAKALPWIKAHYAIKSNPALPLLNDLHARQAGFDCASRVELETVLAIGADKKYVVYSNPIKDESDLEWAEENEIRLTSADSIDELIKIKKIAPKMRILWRIAIKEEASDKLSTPFSGKFGDDIDTPEKIHMRMEEIKNLGINLKGIHFHCGSGMHGSSAFNKAVHLARECLKIGRDYGHQMTIMDVGGGFPSADLNKKTIQALKMTENDPLGYTVIAEPGRHFCGNSFYLLTRVLGKRLKNNKPCYHLNESLYHSFNCNIMDGVSFEETNNQVYKTLNQGEEAPVSNLQTSTLFGMTCDGMDVITKSIGIPTDVKVGDWLCVSGMGAYTYGCRSNFNGMKSTERVIRWSSSFEKSPEVISQPAFELAF